MSQNLFLEVKKPEIKETKGTLIIPKLKSSYWGPFWGLKTQDLIKTSRIFSGVIFCCRSFCGLLRIYELYNLKKKLTPLCCIAKTTKLRNDLSTQGWEKIMCALPTTAGFAIFNQFWNVARKRNIGSYFPEFYSF